MSAHLKNLKALYSPHYQNAPLSDPDQFCLVTADKIHKDYLQLDQRISDLLILQ